MREEYIRDFYNVIIGVLEYRDNGDVWVRKWPATYLGYYDCRSNVTREFPSQKVLSQGNTVGSLLYR